MPNVGPTRAHHIHLAEVLRDTSKRARIRCLRPVVRASRRSKGRVLIEQDVKRWLEVRPLDPEEVQPLDRELETVDDALCTYLAVYAEFRNIFYHRLESGRGLGWLIAKVARRIWRDVPSFQMSCADIGPGFVARHGFSTILTADRIGANCFVHHEVTLGWDDKGTRPPRLGDNVFIGAGAKVLGAVTIGDDVRIGANAVVLRDVPDGCTAVGVPARIIVPPERDALVTPAADEGQCQNSLESSE